MIEDDHPLMNLIHSCISNDPQLRPHASEIVRHVGEVASRFPASFATRLDMLRQIEIEREEKRALIEEGEQREREFQQKDRQISSLKDEIQAEEKKKAAEINRLIIIIGS